MAVSYNGTVVNVNGDAVNKLDTASWSPVNGRGYIGIVAQNRSAATTNTPTVSGNSITWNQVATRLFNGNTARLTVFLGLATAAADGVATADFGGQSADQGCGFGIQEMQGFDSSGTIVQSVVNSGTAGTSASATLAAFGSVNNATLMVVAVANTNATSFAATGYTINIPFVAIDTIRSRSGFRVDNDTGPTMTWTNSGDWGIIAMEIKAAAGGGGLTGTFNKSIPHLVGDFDGTVGAAPVIRRFGERLTFTNSAIQRASRW